MTEHDDATRAVAEAKELIAFGDFPGALAKLRTAVETLPAGRADVLVGRIREAVSDLAKAAPRYGSEVQAIRESVAGRVGVRDTRAEAPSDEPSVYRAAEILSTLALIAACLSVIWGFVGAFGTGTHPAGVSVAWIVGGVLTGAFWFAISVAFALLVDIGRTVRASRSA